MRSYCRRVRGVFELSLLLAPLAQPLEKVLHRDFERYRKLIQRARRYAVGAIFVFLYLLERDCEDLGKHDLGYARFLSPQPQSRGNVAINGIGKTVWHCSKHAPLPVTRQIAYVLGKLPTRYEADVWTFSRFAALVPAGSVSASSR